MKVVGIARDEDGTNLVLTDARGNETRFFAGDEAAALKALLSIVDDASLPETEGDPVHPIETVGEVIRDTLGQVEHEVAAQYGPVVGRITGAAVRNAPRVVGSIFGTLKKRRYSRR